MPGRLEGKVIPDHIAIILDGNGRWAKRRGLPRALGHKAGCDALEQTVRDCAKIGVKYLTVYGFSTENWKRSEEEVSALMNLFRIYLKKLIGIAKEEDCRCLMIGDKSRFAWGTTSENAHALLALAAHCGKDVPANGEKASVTVDGSRSLGEGEFFRRAGGGAAKVANTGKTPVYVSWRATELPKAAPAEAESSGGLSVSRSEADSIGSGKARSSFRLSLRRSHSPAPRGCITPR